jgi:hypothetical protein
MEGLSIIEGKELDRIKSRLENIEQTQLAIIKLLQNIIPSQFQNGVPGYISIADAAEKYKVSHVTINAKMKLFNSVTGRNIDRLQSGNYNLINESELQQALRLRGKRPEFFLRHSEESKNSKKSGK